MMRVISILWLSAGLIFISLKLDTQLTFAHQWALLTNPEAADTFAEVFFVHAQLPRLSMALLVGAVLGLAGSLMQQLSQNTLVSPLTLGTSSGAWLALVIISICWPELSHQLHPVAATAGAMTAFGLLMLVLGRRGLTGLSVVVCGMMINILLGSIATALILLNAQFAQSVFLWGAGDLAQYHWDEFHWLWPKTIVALPLLLWAPRVLMVLRLGQQNASARGLALAPTFVLLLLCAAWLVSVSITTVGMISFIGLLSPNIARLLGARSARHELLASALLGSSLLVAADGLCIAAGVWLGQLVPTGVACALVGVPALILFSLRQLKVQEPFIIVFSPSQTAWLRPSIYLIGGCLVLGLLLYVFVQLEPGAWHWALPGQYQWQLRWPRLVTALFSGLALALAGTVLQRLMQNPLASPDILGVSSGATCLLVITSIYLGSSLLAFHWAIAFLGSTISLLLLLLLSRQHHFSPGSVILVGIALSALLDALVQFFLSTGSQDSYQVLLWLSGSTYRADAELALALALAVCLLAAIIFSLSRWLTLMSVGRQFAAARGLNAQQTYLLFLLMVAAICAITTAAMGPVLFIGLIAPHIARVLGAVKVKAQLLSAGLLGATLMLWADWLGQVVLFPTQLATGTLVASIGSVYFMLIITLQKHLTLHTR